MENKVIQDRLALLRAKMQEEGIDFYMMPTADFHNSEYVNDYFKVREYFSNFTGSNGTLLVLSLIHISTRPLEIISASTLIKLVLMPCALAILLLQPVARMRCV